MNNIIENLNGLLQGVFLLHLVILSAVVVSVVILNFPLYNQFKETSLYKQLMKYHIILSVLSTILVLIYICYYLLMELNLVSMNIMLLIVTISILLMFINMIYTTLILNNYRVIVR